MDAIDAYLEALRRAAHAELQIADAAAQVRLSIIKAVSLALLARSGPLPVGYLGHALSLNSRSIAGAIRDLERRGLVAYDNHTGKHRHTTVTLAPRGAEIAAALLAALAGPPA